MSISGSITTRPAAERSLHAAPLLASGPLPLAPCLWPPAPHLWPLGTTDRPASPIVLRCDQSSGCSVDSHLEPSPRLGSLDRKRPFVVRLRPGRRLAAAPHDMFIDIMRAGVTPSASLGARTRKPPRDTTVTVTCRSSRRGSKTVMPAASSRNHHHHLNLGQPSPPSPQAGRAIFPVYTL
jgi:hypothetical protein